MSTECCLGLLMGSDANSALWGGFLGVPHCGSRGFASENNSGREAEAGNIEYICM